MLHSVAFQGRVVIRRLPCPDINLPLWGGMERPVSGSENCDRRYGEFSLVT